LDLKFIYFLTRGASSTKSNPVRLASYHKIARLELCVRTFLPARCYASTGNSDRNVSVRLSVHPSHAGIVSK